jgi:cysteinyl-tRNA synthetase
MECSAMCLKYLGNTLDIHGGGQDLVFPHHENEIAQSESFTGVKPFVRYWLHNGMVQMGQEKMSKSLGNLITIKDALVRYSADAIRIYVLGSHYRSPLTYSEEILEAAERGAERLRQTVNNPASGGKAAKKIDTEQYRKRFIEAMDDDFNTAQAVAALFDLAREINRYDSEGLEAGGARGTLKELGEVLGLTFQEREETPPDAGALAQNSAIVYETLGLPTPPVATDAGDIIQNLLDLRQKLREDKKWAEADMVRDKLADSGIILTDTSTGPVWKRKR